GTEAVQGPSCLSQIIELIDQWFENLKTAFRVIPRKRTCQLQQCEHLRLALRTDRCTQNTSRSLKERESGRSLLSGADARRYFSNERSPVFIRCQSTHMFKCLFYSSLGYIGVGSLLLEIIECLAALPRAGNVIEQDCLRLGKVTSSKIAINQFLNQLSP